MMKPQDLRWIEIQFYFVLYDIWRLQNNFRDILNFIKCIKIFENDLNESKIGSLAQDALISGRFRFNVDEYVLLSWLNNISYANIRKYRKIHNQTRERLVHQYTANPDDFYFYPRSSVEDIEHMRQFLNAIHKMKGVGIIWKTKYIRSSGKYSKPLDLKH